MRETEEYGQEVALLFPPFFFNHFDGPFLSIPHLAAFLKANGVKEVSLHDINSSIMSEMTSISFLLQMLNEIENNIKITADEHEHKHLLHQKLILHYFLEDNLRLLFADKETYRLLSSVIHDYYYSKITKDLFVQIESVRRDIGIQPLYTVIEEAIAQLPSTLRLIGISVPTADQFFPSLLLALTAKRRFGDAIHLTLGGAIFSFMDRNELGSILANSFIDSIVLHEGEQSLLGLYHYLKGTVALGHVPNLVYQKDGMLKQNPIRKAIPLEDCPVPLFTKDFIDSYRKPFYLPVWATRGCYWGKCTFCDYVHISSNENKVETIKAHKLIDTIEALSKKHRMHHFDLISDCLSPSFCGQFAAGIAARGLNIKWRAMIRVEQAFVENLCEQMALSGCTEVHVGVESFSDRQLVLMGKGYRRPDIISVLQNLNKAGIETAINIIIDFPGATFEEMEETLRFLEEYRSIYSSVTVFPFLLSRLADVARRSSDFGLSLTNKSDVHHCRGFHYIEFHREEGVSEEQLKAMTERYLAFSQMHQRRAVVEKSVEEMSHNPFTSLHIRSQPRFFFLFDDDVNSIISIMKMKPLDHHEALAFDLDCKLIYPCPDAVVQLYKLLPDTWLPFSAIIDVISMDEETTAEKEELVSSLIRYGACRGLFSVRAVKEERLEALDQ